MPLDDRAARQILLAAYAQVLPGQTPTRRALQVIQAIGRHEGRYGTGWTGDMAGSWNWGAITCSGALHNDDGSITCPAGCSANADSLPTKQGQQSYVACFKRYPSSQDGAAGLVAFLHNRPSIWAILDSGDLDAITYQMRLQKYFLGHFIDPHASAKEYADILWKLIPGIAAANSEPVEVYRGDPDHVGDASDGSASASFGERIATASGVALGLFAAFEIIQRIQARRRFR